MDWIVDATDASAVSAFEEDLRRHVRSVAAVSSGVDEAVERVLGSVNSTADTRTWVRLAWPDGHGVVRTRRLAGEPPPLGTGGSVPVQRVASLAPADDGGTTVELSVERQAPRTFEAGPPPVSHADIDPHRDGVAAVAVGLVAVRESHPAADPEQGTAIVGALLGELATDGVPRDLGEALGRFADQHRALGSDVEVLPGAATSAEAVISRCPLGPGVVGHPSACPLTTALAGRLTAMVAGTASVLLERSIARGDDQCHLVVDTSPAASRSGAETFVWPPVASNAGTAPHLDLSVLLPSESASVPVVRRLAAQALRTFGADDDDVRDVELAITEACANVIDHAADIDTYEVRVEIAADRCALTIVDRGGGFDADAVPQEVALTAEDGRGLALMRALVDRVAFRTEARAGAVVHMVKTLSYDADHPLRHG